MNCRRARSNIALWVGNDLDEQSERDVRRHLAICPQCRERAQALRTSLNILEHSAQPPAERMHESLWPSLSQQIRPADSGRRSERFNGWMPALAVVVACVTLVFISDNTTPQNAVWPFGDALFYPQAFYPQASYPQASYPQAPAYPQIVIRAGNLDLHSMEHSIVGIPFLDSQATPNYGDWPGTIWDVLQENVRDAHSVWEQSTPHLNQRVRVTDADY